MRYSPRVIQAVLEHLNGSWQGNTKEIKERYSLVGTYSTRKFIDECKEFAASLGATFVYDEERNHFVCVDAKSDYVERLVKKTLKNHYNQGKSTRRDMATMYQENQIGTDLNEAFTEHQRGAKRIIKSLSD